jgi:2-(1,2-epoxy-1,2-dihydrophenyl)acetyl-CoA isomerase
VDSASPTLLLEQDGGVLWVRLNRPEARNAIDPDMRDALKQVFDGASADGSVRAIVVTGVGTNFCVGGDLKPPQNPAVAITRPTDVLGFRRSVQAFQDLFASYWRVEVPVVSAVNGTTAGGGWMLALLADLVVAARGARWTHAFGRRGMVPHAGDPFFLSRIVPFHKLNEAALLGETLTSETMHEWGLVNRLVDASDVQATASELAQGPTLSFGQTKRLYRRALESDMVTSFAEEAAAAAMISQTDDRMEGVRSLLEGRRPDFSGH